MRDGHRQAAHGSPQPRDGHHRGGQHPVRPRDAHRRRGDGGIAIHVLGDIAGQEIELLAFDCFRIYPHYHYGPRYKNERIYLDKTLVPDPFAWAIEQFKGGRLPAMLTRAGYPTVAAALDEGLVARKVTEVEERGRAMMRA